MKKNLLFVTYHDEDCDEGLCYAIYLAKIMNVGITILLVYDNKLMKIFDNVMTAITFAEAGEHETAREAISGNGPDASDKHITILINKCRESGVDVNVTTDSRDVVPAVRDFLKQKRAIDMVLLSPSVTGNGNVSQRALNRLVRTASRPVVTIARHAFAV